jgi:hypothetical protein
MPCAENLLLFLVYFFLLYFTACVLFLSYPMIINVVEKVWRHPLHVFHTTCTIYKVTVYGSVDKPIFQT